MFDSINRIRGAALAERLMVSGPARRGAVVLDGVGFVCTSHAMIEAEVEDDGHVGDPVRLEAEAFIGAPVDVDRLASLSPYESSISSLWGPPAIPPVGAEGSWIDARLAAIFEETFPGCVYEMPPAPLTSADSAAESRFARSAVRVVHRGRVVGAIQGLV